MNTHRRYSPATILLCGGGIIMLSLGIRHGFGIFLRPMTLDLQWPRSTFAFAIALQNLVWGFSQPFVGMVADRYGAGRVLAVGGLLYAAGLALMAQATTSLELALSTGVLIGLGLSGTYTIVFGVVSRAVAPEKRSTALGLLSGLASFGQFAMLPYGQALISCLSRASDWRLSRGLAGRVRFRHDRQLFAGLDYRCAAQWIGGTGQSGG